MDDGEQLALPGTVRAARKRSAVPPPAAAATRPVARVVVDLPLAHLDRPFDYLVPARFDEAAVPGARVRLRFAGRLVDGFLVERLEASEHVGRLAFLDRVVSAEPVLSAELLTLCRSVADRWAGTLADVLRLAIPTRHARAEAAASGEPPAEAPIRAPDGWQDYAAGPSFLRALADGGAPRAVWTPAPGSDWAQELALAVASTAAGGRGALVVVPDGRDAARLHSALGSLIPSCRAVLLTAELGPQARYSRWLQVSRGESTVVVGTRSAVFAPVQRLGLVAIWDDGDDVYAEPRAPYPHTREVLLMRAHQLGCAAIVGSHARTTEAASLLSTGWAHPVEPTRALLRARGPRVEVSGDDSQLARDAAARQARLPTMAWQAARTALAADLAVLVQVPRRGYAPSLACAQCRTPARCARCAGPLGVVSADTPPRCRWCGLLAADWTCHSCGAHQLRATAVGARRTAEELGRAFPGHPVRTSSGDAVLDSVPAGAQLVVATPGAEPRAPGGFGAALLLDTWSLLTRPGMRAGEEALRRWRSAAALVRGADEGGRVVVVADAGLPVVQALVRADPGGWAERELAERAALRLPPSVRMAAVTGTAAAVAELATAADLPDVVEQLGPVEVGPDQVRLVLRVDRRQGSELAAHLKAAQAVRSARRAEGAVKVELDPLEPL